MRSPGDGDAARPSPAGAQRARGPCTPTTAGARVRRERRTSRVAGLARFALFLFLVFVAVWAGVRVANATSQSETFDGRPYRVQAGDTLWRIAGAEYGDTARLRAVVYEIREANGLDGALLEPGQDLTLPYIEP